jgi:hypothetical protein
VLELTITLLLAAHLLCMNVASAGPLVGAWLAWRGEDELRRYAFQTSGCGLLVGSLLGGALLAWPQEGMRAALERFPADAYWFAALELLFSGACIAALIWGGDKLGRHKWLVAGVAAVSASNLLYHFPPLMAVLGKLAVDPAWASEETIDRATLLRLWRRPEVLALWTHFTLASGAVAAVFALWPAVAVGRRRLPTFPAAVARRLGAIALAASAAQIPVGLWLLSTASQSERQSVMGDDLLATLVFAAGVMAAIWLLQTLLAVALGEGSAAIRRAAMLLVAVTLLMTATLRSSRQTSGNRAEHAKPRSGGATIGAAAD